MNGTLSCIDFVDVMTGDIPSSRVRLNQQSNIFEKGGGGNTGSKMSKRRTKASALPLYCLSGFGGKQLV